MGFYFMLFFRSADVNPSGEIGPPPPSQPPPSAKPIPRSPKFAGGSAEEPVAETGQLVLAGSHERRLDARPGLLSGRPGVRMVMRQWRPANIPFAALDRGVSGGMWVGGMGD